MPKKSKMVSLQQVMEIEIVANQFKVGGVVKNSNFLQEGVRHIFPVDDKVAKKLKEGDKIKITHFTMEDDINKTENRVTFKNKGTRYEIWNTENNGWDRLWEYFPKDEDDE